MTAVHTTAHHASLVGAMIVPGLVGLMVLPAFIARCFGWGDDDARTGGTL